MGRLAAVVAVLTTAVACSTSPLPTSSPATSRVTSSTAPAETIAPATTSSPAVSNGMTRIWKVDPATLERRTEELVLVGQSGSEHAVLPDGRLVLPSWEGLNWTVGHVSVIDPETMTAQTFDAVLSSGVRIVGWSGALDRVILLDDQTAPARKILTFDPRDGSIVEVGNIANGTWPTSWDLLQDGRLLATYGQSLTDGPAPPRVALVDLTIGQTVLDFELGAVAHGPVAIPPELATNPDWPFAEVQPGVVWDRARRLLYVVHADGSGVSVAHLDTGTIRTEVYESPPLWARALGWLVGGPAYAKAGNRADRVAWLSSDGSRLLSVAVQEDGIPDDAGSITWTTTPLGLLVIDTQTLERVEAPLLPAGRGAYSPGGAWALAGDDSWYRVDDGTVVDEESRAHGLYVVDPTTLEVVMHHGEGANFYPVGFMGGYLITERFGDDGDFYESIDTSAFEPAARQTFGDSFFVPTDIGLFELLNSAR